MSTWTIDLLHSIVEAALDLIDAFARVPARAYLVTSIVIGIVVIIAAIGPHT